MLIAHKNLSSRFARQAIRSQASSRVVGRLRNARLRFRHFPPALCAPLLRFPAAPVRLTVLAVPGLSSFLIRLGQSPRPRTDRSEIAADVPHTEPFARPSHGDVGEP